MAKTQKRYIIRSRIYGGGAYLATRKNHSPAGKYFWTKTTKDNAAILTEGAARSAAKRYGGTMVQI